MLGEGKRVCKSKLVNKYVLEKVLFDVHKLIFYCLSISALFFLGSNFL